MFTLNGFQFDRRAGELRLPTSGTRVYASPANAYVGAQLLPPNSEPFKLQLTRYDTPFALAYNRNLAITTRGQIVSIVDEFGIHYDQLPYLLRFFVADVQLLTADQIIRAQGYRGPTAYAYAPASRVTTEWTLYPIPADS